MFVTGIKNAEAFYAAREVLPAMVEAGRGTILLTAASGAARQGPVLGARGRQVWIEGAGAVHGQGVRAAGDTVSHVIIDGQINTPSMRGMSPDREEHTLLSPDAIAETYWRLHTQDRTAWTLEADLRPSVENL
jgi:hypothetical protein